MSRVRMVNGRRPTRVQSADIVRAVRPRLAEPRDRRNRNSVLSSPSLPRRCEHSRVGSASEPTFANTSIRAPSAVRHSRCAACARRLPALASQQVGCVPVRYGILGGLMYSQPLPHRGRGAYRRGHAAPRGQLPPASECPSPRNDGDVRGRAPARGYSGELGAVECDQLRRQQLARDQDGFGGQLRTRGALAAEGRQYARLEIEQVIRSLGPFEVIECPQCFVPSRRTAPPGIARHSYRSNQTTGTLYEIRVVKPDQVCRGDFACRANLPDEIDVRGRTARFRARDQLCALARDTAPASATSIVVRANWNAYPTPIATSDDALSGSVRWRRRRINTSAPTSRRLQRAGPRPPRHHAPRSPRSRAPAPRPPPRHRPDSLNHDAVALRIPNDIKPNGAPRIRLARAENRC